VYSSKLIFAFRSLSFGIFQIAFLLLFSVSCDPKVNKANSSIIEDIAGLEDVELEVNEDILLQNETPDSLHLGEYLVWLKNQKGLTFAEAKNDQLDISILFRPLEVEAALSIEDVITYDRIEEIKGLKKDYLFFEINYLDKIVSVNKEKDSKDKLIQAIRKTVFVETESGAVYNSIFEFFPPVIMNQPGKALLLVPAIAFDSWIKVTIAGKKFSFPDISLNISKEALKEFPKIKI
jgi:hypothetical protein